MVYSSPQPLSAFIDRVQKGQHALSPTIQAPLLSTLAVLLLSCHTESIFNGTEETMIMSFFGAFWIFTGPRSITGYFSTQEEAVQYVLGNSAEARGAGDE